MSAKVDGIGFTIFVSGVTVIICLSPPRSTIKILPSNDTIEALVMMLPVWAPPIGNDEGFGEMPGGKNRTTSAVPSGLPVMATNGPGVLRSSGFASPSIRTVALSATRTLRTPVLVTTDRTRPSMESTWPFTVGDAAAAGNAAGLAPAAGEAAAAGDAAAA